MYIQAYVGEVEVASGTFDVDPWREGFFFLDAGIGSHSVGSSRSVITNGNPPPPAHQESVHSTVLISRQCMCKGYHARLKKTTFCISTKSDTC